MNANLYYDFLTTFWVEGDSVCCGPNLLFASVMHRLGFMIDRW